MHCRAKFAVQHNRDRGRPAQPPNPAARASAATDIPVITARNSLRRTMVTTIAAMIAKITTGSPVATIGVGIMKSASYWGVAGALRPDGKGLTLTDTTCGNLHRNGVFFPGSKTRTAKITDGTSNTLAIGERT